MNIRRCAVLTLLLLASAGALHAAPAAPGGEGTIPASSSEPQPGSLPPISIEPDPETAEPNWMCGEGPAVEGGPANGKLNEALLGPVEDFYATLIDGSERRIETLNVRFRSAAGGVNKLTIKRLRSKPEKLEWRMNEVKLLPAPARSFCVLPHELLQRIERNANKKIIMEARLWDGGETRKVTRATLIYKGEPPQSSVTPASAP